MNTKQTHFHRAFWPSLLLVIALLSVVNLAQAPTSPPTKPPAQPEDELIAKMRTARDDPPQSVELLVRLVQEFPTSRYAESAGYNFANALKKQAQKDNDPAKLRALAERFIAGTTAAPAPLRMRINGTALRAMLDNNLAEQAATLARQTIAGLNEQEYMTFLRNGYDRDMAAALKANPKYNVRPFAEAEYRERFRQESAAYSSQLGRAHLQLNDLAQAEAAFKKAYEIAPDAPSAQGLATVLEKRGKDAEALPYLTEARLTGKLDKAGIEQFQNLYRRTHGGKLDGVEEYLDDRYRQTQRNPLTHTKRAASPVRTGRAVLAEFFTGAGCIPCIPFDYSFETAIETYSRKELVLLVYHWHAPTLDPMGNRSSDARVKYYGVQGAPTLFVNGQKFNDKGDGDARVKTEAEKKAANVYASVTEVINRELTNPPAVQLQLKAVRVGKDVKAMVTAQGLKADATLHLALVEDEVHYSGENGLRFHPMVVRNLAQATGQTAYGFKVAPGQTLKVEHVFALDNIINANLRYYTEWPEERNKEVNARIGGSGAEFDVGSFREQRHLINRQQLSVVAFVQDNQTKAILQAVFLKVPKL